MALPTINELLANDLFELLGLSDASDEKKAALIKTMTDTVDARVINRVTTMMSEKDAQEFGRLAESADQERLIQFLVDHQIDLPQIVSEEAARLRVELVELSRLTLEK